MATLDRGTPAAEVGSTLGPPDVIRRGTNSDGQGRLIGMKEVWCYGTSRPETLATLGGVYIDQNDEVHSVFGGSGTPPPPGLFEESQLRQLLEIINDTPQPYRGDNFDPRDLIRAVNTLQPLGKEKAVAAIGEYLRIKDRFSRRRQGVHLLLRALFEVPAGSQFIPTMRIGAPDVRPSDPVQFPYFPLIIVDDVPFMLVGGYSIGGSPQPPENDLEYFIDNCQIRTKPLHPGSDLAGLLERTMQQAALADPDHVDRMSARIGRQFIRLADTVYRAPPIPGDGRIVADAPVRWAVIKAGVTKLPVRWDGSNNRYVLADGSTLRTD